MKKFKNYWLSNLVLLITLSSVLNYRLVAQIGVGAKPEKGAEMFFDGSRKMLDEKWEYW
ncbi:MAG: DUF1080 domain-containing protein, partial [Saprospiraceae bacterium]